MNGIAWSPPSASMPGISCGVGTGFASADASISDTSAITAVSFGSASSSLMYHLRASTVLPLWSDMSPSDLNAMRFSGSNVSARSNTCRDSSNSPHSYSDWPYTICPLM